MSEFQGDIYDFGEFRVDASKRLLIKGGGEPLPLTPKVFDLLLYLVQNCGKLIEKDELMSAIWTDTIVEENNLSQNISILRRILGKKRGEHQFIATIPGRGYKFVAPVRISPPVESDLSESEKEAESKPEARNQKPETAKNPNRKIFIFGALILFIAAISAVYFWRQKPVGSPVKTVAVLPFKPLGAENRDEILETGMADTLIARLGTNPEIVVRPLSSVRHFDKLEQDPLSLIINTLKAQSFFYAERDAEAIEQLNKTLEIEPNFWITHIMLARVYLRQNKFDEAVTEADKAAEFSGGNSEAASLAAYALAKSGRREEALKMLEDLKSKSNQRYVPAYNIAMIYNGLGYKEETLNHLEKAFNEKDARMILLKVEPKWDALRNEPRFIETMRRMNFE